MCMTEPGKQTVTFEITVRTGGLSVDPTTVLRALLKMIGRVYGARCTRQDMWYGDRLNDEKRRTT